MPSEMLVPRISQGIHALMAVAAKREKQRFDADAENVQAVNDQTLLTLLRHNKDTEFGHRHGFVNIQSVNAFRQTLGVAMYDSFRGDIERIARGEKNILTADHVTHLGVTSGTTGVGKMIPMTDVSRKSVAKAMTLLVQGFLADNLQAARFSGRGLLLMSATLPKKSDGGLPMGASTSVGMAGMLRMSHWIWTSPPEAYQAPTQADAMYLHLLFGLRDPFLRYLGAPFASGVLDLFHTLERYWPQLVEDIGSGALRKDVELPPELRTRIEKRLNPQPKLAKTLEQEFSRGFEDIARRVFPGIGWINTVCGGSFAVYAEKFAKYAGNLPVYSSVYGSTEAMMGVGLGPGKPVYVMTPRAAFYEFIPTEAMDDSNPETRLIGELEEGKRYEIVVTTQAGLYRYRMGDVVQVVGHYRSVPIVDFLYRRGGLLNLVGEKTSEDAAYAALVGTLSRDGHELVDYTIMPDLESTPERYVFFVELGREAQVTDVEALSKQLDAALCKANPFYELMRGPKKLGEAVFHQVEPGTFRLLKDVLVRRGASPSQAKVPRVVRDAEMLAVLGGRICKAKS